MIFRSSSLLSPATATLSVLLLISAITTPTILSQNTGPALPRPSISGCATTLLPLAPCMPFVQGSGSSSGQSLPTPLCCNNLDRLYRQEPGCLCLILNNTTLSSFPINTTLAMEMPALCNLTANVHDCPGASEPVVPSTASPQVSLGAHDNSSSNASSPMIQVGPRPSMLGFGFGRGTGAKSKAKWSWAISAALFAILLIK